MAETNVYFMRTPLDSTYQHTLYFKNRTEQENYFATKVIYSMLNCTATVLLNDVSILFIKTIYSLKKNQIKI